MLDLHIALKCKMSLVKFIFVILVLYNSYLVSSISETQRVSPNCTKVDGQSCIELDGALQSLVSNTILHLEPGRHVLYTYHGWHTFSLHDISIIGIEAETVINCHKENGVSMTFINVTNLFISNITIDGCGLTGTNLQNATGIIKSFLFVNFLIPDSIKIGLFLAHCTNLQMENSLINNTRGLGLLGINILGNSNITNTNFTHNIRPKCMNIDPSSTNDRNQIKPMQIGGGAYFLYFDYRSDYANFTKDMNSTISITRCNFKYNAECTSSGFRNVDYQYLQNPEHIIGGGGGLSIYIPQITYSVTAQILGSNFIKNDARFGGGVQIGLFAGFTKSIVQIYECSFDRNGFEIEGKSQAEGGAGITIFMDLLRYSNAAKSPSTINCEQCKQINIIYTNFTGNSAHVQGGGVLAYSFSKNFRVNYGLDHFNAILQLSNCLFQHNSAKYGSGLYVSQRTTQGVDGAWALVLSDIIVRNNTVPIPDGGIGPDFDNIDKISTVDLRNILVRIERGNVSVEGNSATGIRVMSSIIYLLEKTSLILKDNQASRGGGIYMDGDLPTIIASNRSTLELRNNIATAEGGGIYYERQPAENLILEPLHTLDCFITTYTTTFGKGMFNSNITVVFAGNMAPIGSMVFGSTLNSCSWAKQFNLSDKDLFLELYNNKSSTFRFSHIPKGKHIVSTMPNSISVSKSSKSISLYPGEEQTIEVSVLDVFENPIEAVITSSIIEKHSANVSLGFSGLWYNNLLNQVPIHVNGTSDSPIMLSLYTVSNLVQTNITVNVLRCPSGFVYNNTCQCSPLLSSNGIQCDSNTVRITVPKQKWLGCVNHSSKCSAKDLMLLECYFNQCTSEEVVFNQSNYSDQCANHSHRAGIMCGSCDEGYSILLGNNNCGQCSNADLGILVAVTVISGLILFAAIALFQITIDKGWTNMLILFSNTVFPYSFPTALALHSYQNLLIPLCWINLDLGFDLCIYDGATSLIRTIYYIILPLYLYTLMFFFALLCRYSSFVSRHFSPNKSLITLTFLTYISILYTCAEILAPVNVKTLDGNNGQVRWLIDPSVTYFKGWHAALVVASIVVISIYIIPFPLLLLSPTLAYKYGKRFKPVFDAIWAPFKTKYRFWASVRFLLRILIIMSTKFFLFSLSYGFNINIFFLVVFLFFQTYIQPFKDNVINFFDNFLILIALFIHSLEYYTVGNFVPYSTVFLVILSYLVIVLTFLWYSRLPVKRLWNRIMSCCCRRSRERRFTFDTLERSIQGRPTHTSVSITSPESSEWMPHAPHRRNFSRVRESLLEDEALHFISN